MSQQPENSRKDGLSPEGRRQAEQLFRALDGLSMSDRTKAIEEADVDELVRAEVIRRDSALQETLQATDGEDGHTEKGDEQPVGNEPPTVSAVGEEDSSQSPRRIGPCTLKRLLGAGGMGRVFEAEQDYPRRTVALKIMSGALASKQAHARFQYEVQILGRLSHPNIAQVYGAGTWEDQGVDLPYFIMEYVPGRTIGEYVQVNTLDVYQILELFLQVCDAISHGHERGIMHRDLKPGNILVDGKGRVKVIDFGVARATDGEGQGTHAQTSAGQLIGTLQYMSPEQCAADPNDIDIRTDVYSLGVVLFELIANKLPYEMGSGTIPDAVRAIQEDAPTRLSTFHERIPRDLEVIVGKALEKKPTRRYRSAGDFGDDIRRLLDDEAIIARPPTLSEHIRRYARKHRAVATAVVMVAVTLVLSIAAIIYFGVEASQQRDIAEREAIRARTAQAETERALTESEERFELLRSVFGDLFGDLLLQVKNLPGGTRARQTILAMAQRHLADLKAVADESTNAELQVEVARAHEAMGDLYGGYRTVNLGQPEAALEEYRAAEKIWRAIKQSDGTANATVLLSRVLQKQADLELEESWERAKELLVESRRLALEAYELNPNNIAFMRRYYISLERFADTLLASEIEGNNAEALLLLTEYRDLALKLTFDYPEVAKYRRDVGMALRRMGYVRMELSQLGEAEEALRSSLSYFETNQTQEPENIRHGRDIAWGCWYLSRALVIRDKATEAIVFFVRSAREIVEVCVLDPNAADYRNDVRDLLPAICAELAGVAAADKAREVRQSALIRLQPVQERNPDNSALQEVIAVVRAIEVPLGSPAD